MELELDLGMAVKILNTISFIVGIFVALGFTVIANFQAIEGVWKFQLVGMIVTMVGALLYMCFETLSSYLTYPHTSGKYACFIMAFLTVSTIGLAITSVVFLIISRRFRTGWYK